MDTKIILLFVVFFNLLLGAFVFTQRPNALSNRLFSLLAFLGAVWTFTDYMMSISISSNWFIGSYALGALVIAVGLIWTIVITEKKLSKRNTTAIIITALVFCFASMQHGFIINPIDQIYPGTVFVSKPGWGLPLYSIYYLLFSFLIVWKLYIAQRNTNDIAERSQFKYVLIGAFITLTTSAFTSFITPLSSVVLSQTLDSTGFLIFLSFIAYSITRHHLFNIKVIAIELVTFGLWIIIVMHALLTNNVQEIFLDGVLLIVTVIFGVLLIKGVFHEISQREKIDRLTGELERAYGQLRKLNDFLDLRDGKSSNH